MEIVIVSDTVRQRRSRTPSSSVQTSQSDSVTKDAKSNVMPDLLPKTFHLAESSVLFSQVDNLQNVLARKDSNDSNESKVAIVEIRETNLIAPERATYKMHENLQSQNVGQILNTCSILESVNYLEPSCVETVHIIDATSEPSDTETPCSTPNLDDRSDCKLSSEDDNDDDESDECDYETDTMKIINKRMSVKKRDVLDKNRDLPKQSKEFDSTIVPKKPQRKKLTPTLKEILSASSDRDSFYGADKEVFDEPLTFSDDDDNNHLDGQSTEKFNRDTVKNKPSQKQKKNKTIKISKLPIAMCFVLKKMYACMRFNLILNHPDKFRIRHKKIMHSA